MAHIDVFLPMLLKFEGGYVDDQEHPILLGKKKGHGVPCPFQKSNS
jgi:hypothetical protein